MLRGSRSARAALLMKLARCKSMPGPQLRIVLQPANCALNCPLPGSRSFTCSVFNGKVSRRMDLYVGTSGYAYKPWKGPFYPEDLPDKQMLHYYGERFRSVEINN